MKHFLTLLSHEIRMLLVNPSTYIAATLFLAVMGFMFTGILEAFSKAPQETSPAQMFFQSFWLPVFFMVPLLTMKSLAEERRLGTIETLLTTPVTTTEVVLGKYGAAYFLYMLLWSSTGGFFYILSRFAGDDHFLDPGPLVGGFLFVAVSGLLFIAIGIFASSLSRNQAVAGILGFTMIFALIVGTNFLAQAQWLNRDVLSPVKSAVEYAQIFQHLEDFTRGVVDTRQILFYLSGTVLVLIFSILGVEAKLLHS
ncbi:ABC transporter permease subunit [Horticoccus luteus]|uniref:ABC transporter permease subunit n=1 Tax=Horticoccus luteus TaxID=2862869 RepID=A0A8F9XKU6_9BACT|nr:ABC transporter permease [Horticoccus luteus]QYM80048.1 ABC transporter permease subunit [Horticoccus luteus]